VPYSDAQRCEVGHRLGEETGRGGGFFIRHHGGKGDAGVVVDSHVEELPSGAAGLVARVAGNAVAGLDDAGQLLDVDVQQIAGRGVFVAHDGDLRLQHLRFVQLQPGQDAAEHEVLVPL